MANLNKTKLTWVAVAVVVLLVGVAVLPALCQPQGGPPGGQGMDGMPPGPPPGMGGAALAVADGIVYVASDGKLMAFDAKSLKKLGEAQYGNAMQEPPR